MISRDIIITTVAAIAFFALPAPAAALPSSEVAHPAVEHMVTDRRLDVDPERTERLVEQVMAFSDDEIDELILPRHGLQPPPECPECGHPKLQYSLERHDRFTCPDCDAEITADSLPIDTELSGENPLGEMVTYECATVDRNPVCLAGAIRYARHHEMAAAARALAETYHETGDEALADRAVRTMERFAEVYPHWPIVKTSKPRSYLWRYEINPPRPWDEWGVAKWTRLFQYEIPQDLLFAYDLTYDAGAWDDNLRRTVEDTLFRDALELSLTVHEDMGGHITNLNPTLYQRMIHLGRVLNEPDVVHQAVRFMQDMIRMSYHFDGMEFEGAMAYHGVVTGRLGIGVRMLQGYVDPEGYEDERFGITIGRGERPLDFPIHSKAWDVWSMMKYPDGHQVYIHDTNWVVGRPEVEDDAVIPNIVLNAYGHYALGGGIGRDGMQAHLHFCPRNRGPHYHADRLSMILWGADEELLPDIGYQHVGEPARYFANRQTAHNMVHVLFDEDPQEPEIEEPTDLPTDPVARFKTIAEAERSLIDAHSRVLAYDPGTVSDGRVQLVSASSPGPEWMGIERRERSLLMVRVDDRRSYLVDVFRVRGGDRHRFILRGSADEDMRVAHALDLKAVPGTLAGEDVAYAESSQDAEPYTWFVHNLKRSQISDPWQMTWTGEDSGSSVRMFVAGDEGSEVTLGQSPSLRRANHDPRTAHDFMAPHLLVERDESGAGNLFAAVYDVWPDESAPAVQSVGFERLGEGAEAPLVVRVRLAGGREDVIYASLDRDQREVGRARFAGPWAMISSADGAARWAWARDGSVAADGLTLGAAQRQELALVEVRRAEGGDDASALVVEDVIPNADALVGTWVRALLGDGAAYAYEVEAVRSDGERTAIEVAGEPGFALTEDGGWELLFNPFYEGDGPCRVEIARSAFASAR
ncbi:MAG: hypothetical protein ACQER1_07225 [Armatimonadota bacterium]